MRRFIICIFALLFPNIAIAQLGPTPSSPALVKSVAGRIGNVTLTLSDIGDLGSLAALSSLSGLDGSLLLVTPTGSTSSQSLNAILSSYLTTSIASTTYQPLLGYTPYNNTNPAGYQTATQLSTAVSAETARAESAEGLLAPKTSPTYTTTMTLSGSSSTPALELTNGIELTNLVASYPASTQPFYVANGSVQYYTSNATYNWTLNIMWSSGSTFNSITSVGNSVTIVLLVTQGATAYFMTALQIDGTTTGVSTYWSGGTAPAAGNATGVDSYTCTIIKTTTTPTYTALCAITQY